MSFMSLLFFIMVFISPYMLFTYCLFSSTAKMVMKFLQSWCYSFRIMSKPLCALAAIFFSRLSCYLLQRRRKLGEARVVGASLLLDFLFIFYISFMIWSRFSCSILMFLVFSTIVSSNSSIFLLRDQFQERRTIFCSLIESSSLFKFSFSWSICFSEPDCGTFSFLAGQALATSTILALFIALSSDSSSQCFSFFCTCMMYLYSLSLVSMWTIFLSFESSCSYMLSIDTLLSQAFVQRLLIFLFRFSIFILSWFSQLSYLRILILLSYYFSPIISLMLFFYFYSYWTQAQLFFSSAYFAWRVLKSFSVYDVRFFVSSQRWRILLRDDYCSFLRSSICFFESFYSLFSFYDYSCEILRQVLAFSWIICFSSSRRLFEDRRAQHQSKSCLAFAWLSVFDFFKESIVCLSYCSSAQFLDLILSRLSTSVLFSLESKPSRADLFYCSRCSSCCLLSSYCFLADNSQDNLVYYFCLLSICLFSQAIFSEVFLADDACSAACSFSCWLAFLRVSSKCSILLRY